MTPKLIDLTLVGAKDESFTRFENDYFKVTRHSGGEFSFKLRPAGQVIYNSAPVLVNIRLTSPNEVSLLFSTLETLKQLGIKNIGLNAFYFPYARADRKFQEDDGTIGGIDLKWIVRFINSYQLDKVFIFNPHSDVTPALIDNVEVVSNIPFIKWAAEEVLKVEGTKRIVFFAPDSGADRWVSKVGAELNIPVFSATKNRIIATNEPILGRTNYNDFNNAKVVVVDDRLNDDDLSGADVILVDDICDGGRTFVNLAKSLEGRNINRLWLCIGHGIFSYGYKELEKVFTGIFTTNSVIGNSDISNPTFVKKFNLND